MRTSRTWILGVLVAAAGYAAGCSSDGTGPVPSGAGGSTGSETTTQGAAGSGGPSSAGGTTSAAITTGAAGSSSEATSAAGTTSGTTSVGGSTGDNETTSVGGRTGGDATTGEGGSTAAGGSAGVGGATSTGGSTGAGGNTGAAGSTGAGGTTGAGGRTGRGGSAGAAGGAGVGGATAAGGSTGGGGSTGAGGMGAGGNTGAGGTSGTAASFWPSAYKATVGSSGMNTGRDCMSSCHNHGFAFAGTVYDSTGKALSSVQVGVKLTSGQFYSVFSGSDGNFYSQGSTINLAGADIRVRDANGERQMPTPSTSGGCNSCHDGSANPRVSAP